MEYRDNEDMVRDLSLLLLHLQKTVGGTNRSEVTDESSSVATIPASIYTRPEGSTISTLSDYTGGAVDSDESTISS